MLLEGNTSGPSFESSAMRPYTGPYGPDGPPVIGTGGVTGATGVIGADGHKGITGPTGSTILGTFFQTDPDDPNYGYWVMNFSSQEDGKAYGNVVATASPHGLTGKPGNVTGATAYFGNSGGGITGIFINAGPHGVSYGTHPVTGRSGATLSFRRICASGDLVLYFDHLLGIGTGSTHTMIGISGPVTNFFGGITSNSIGELAYLSDRKNVKDAHGLTFTAVGLTAGAGTNGLTWGTISTKFVNHSEFFSIHGNVVEGVSKDPFYINTDTGNVHLLYAPFNLRGITLDFNGDRNPIVTRPAWDGITGGTTAEFGESVSVTLIIDGGPRGIEFGEGFYMPKNGITFTHGRDIINCLSYDNGKNWFVTPSGFGYGVTGPVDESVSLGSCVDTNEETCEEFLTRSDCRDKVGSHFIWNALSSCEESGYLYAETDTNDDIDPVIWGSCCLNRINDSDSTEAFCEDFGATADDDTNNWMTREKCEKFGGLFRRLVPCTSDFPCGDPCDENFGQLGACCQFNGDGSYSRCDRYTAYECGALYPDSSPQYTIFHGLNTFCEKTSCCSYEGKYGACCSEEGVCLDQMRPLECKELDSTYMGHDSTCDTIRCNCPETYALKSSCIVCNEATNQCNCCDQATYGGCISYAWNGGGEIQDNLFWSPNLSCDDYIVGEPDATSQGYERFLYHDNVIAGYVTPCEEHDGAGCIGEQYDETMFRPRGHCCYTEEVQNGNECGDDCYYEVFCEEKRTEQECYFMLSDTSRNIGDVKWNNFTSDDVDGVPVIHGAGCSCPQREGYNDDAPGEFDGPNGVYCGLFHKTGENAGQFYQEAEEAGAGGGNGGDPRNNDPNLLGSCCIYPRKDSCTKDLDFSCFNVNQIACNNIRDNFNKLYGYDSYGVRFSLGQCCCTTEECNGNTNAPGNEFPSVSFNDCITSIYGPAALDCGGACRESEASGCGFRENTCVFDCNCSAQSAANQFDDSSYINYACCDCDPECDEIRSMNTFCGNGRNNCRTSCENCPVNAYEAGGACCCKDYSEEGLAECQECRSCTYMTEEECTRKQFESNNCPDPLDQSESYECDCEFFPEKTCSDLSEDECAAATVSDLEYTPMILPVRGSRVSPKIVNSNGIRPVPTSREQLSGVICSNSGFEIVYDLYEYILQRGSWISETDENGQYQIFMPFTPEIYSLLTQFSSVNLPNGQNGKEHFIQMASIGGHGINRPMSSDEMAIIHGTNNLRSEHFEAMRIVYEAEKTIIQSQPAGFYNWYTSNSDLDDYCGCGKFNISDIEMAIVSVSFPLVNSPISKTDCIEIMVPKYTEHYVARRLGGLVSGNSCSNARNYNGKNSEPVGGKSTIVNIQNMRSNAANGTCILKDGRSMICGKEYCNSLGGRWRERSAKIESNNDYTKVVNGKGISYRNSERGPFDVGGYYPLYDTIDAAINASPDPTLVRIELSETTAGYHTHTLNGQTYYMPNGLEMGVTQFHGDHYGQSSYPLPTQPSNDQPSNDQPSNDQNDTPTPPPSSPSGGGSSNTYSGGY